LGKAYTYLSMSGPWSFAHLLVLSAAVVVGVCTARAYRPPNDDCARAHAKDREHRAKEKALRGSRRNVRIYFIRHAESSGNALDKTLGSHFHGRSIHFHLSEKGQQQAIALGRRWKAEGVSFDRVFASEAIRAQETANLVCAQLDSRTVPPLEIISTTSEPRPRGICEISMGGWTGKKQSEVLTPEMVEARNRDTWEFRPPGVCPEEKVVGESYKDCEERFSAFLEDFVLTPTEGEKVQSGKYLNVAVFSHYAAIRAVLRVLLECSPRMLAPKLELINTSVTTLQYDTKPGRMGGWTLIGLNDAYHLPPDNR